MTAAQTVEHEIDCQNDRVFLVSGSIPNWCQARRLGYWGLPSEGVSWPAARARLQEIGFGSASVILAVAAPRALFSAVVDGDPFYDDTVVFGHSSLKKPYAVRFRLTRVIDEGCDWFDGRHDVPWRAGLRDLFFGKKSLYAIDPRAAGWPAMRPLFETHLFRALRAGVK